MESVEAEGDSIDAAITAALKLLGTTRERVEIEILTNSSRGLFGIGGRKARVRAAVRSPILAETVNVESGAQRGKAAPPAPTPPAVVPAATPAAPLDRAVGERAAKLLTEIAQHIGVGAGVVVRAEDDHILLELTGDTSGVLIGRRGQMLDALEYLINRIVGRDEGGAARLVIDSQNYRARRRASLEEMAQRMGEQAKKRGKPVTLNPMSPHDRRLVHLALKADPSLTTRSAGKGYFRRLVIIPAGVTRAARERH